MTGSQSAGVQAEAYGEASRRLYRDSERLYQERCYATATHLYGLAVECALKDRIERSANHSQQTNTAWRRKHVPEIISDANHWLSGKRHKGINGLLQKKSYMVGWRIDNRYWPDINFGETDCSKYRDDAQRTFRALGKI